MPINKNKNRHWVPTGLMSIQNYCRDRRVSHIPSSTTIPLILTLIAFCFCSAVLFLSSIWPKHNKISQKTTPYLVSMYRHIRQHLVQAGLRSCPTIISFVNIHANSWSWTFESCAHILNCGAFRNFRRSSGVPRSCGATCSSGTLEMRRNKWCINTPSIESFTMPHRICVQCFRVWLQEPARTFALWCDEVSLKRRNPPTTSFNYRRLRFWVRLMKTTRLHQFSELRNDTS